MKEIRLEVSRNTRLDDFLTKDAGVSKRLIAKLKRIENGITRNGCLIRTIDKVEKGDIIVLKCNEGKVLEPNRELHVPIVFENENVVVFDKPYGMPVHPSIKHQGDTLGNFFAAVFEGVTFRPVNRLDRDTSGLCLVAKNSFSAAGLQKNVRKVYYAAVSGHPPECGTVNAPIGREQQSIIKRIVCEDGQTAITHYKNIKSVKKYSLMEINLETGRTHQIRVHFSYIGYPLAGDDMYGGDMSDIDRQALHCGRLEFCEPVTGEKITIDSPLSEDIKKLFER